MRQFKFSVWLLCMTIGFYSVSIAQASENTCANNGYTIATINGVLTDESRARDNMVAVSKKVGFEINNQIIDYQYLLNHSHAGGLGDAIKVIYQKYFEQETVRDYDLVEMLNDASQKVKTQKLLLVAHSQGNFYANSFYDVVAGQTGGLPREAIGIYSVANPASRVAGGGKWITSDTDKVIADVVAIVPFRKIMEPNTHIELKPGDNISGHGFSDAYLKYRSDRIISEIQMSLDSLFSDLERREDIPCIDPPKLSFVHKVQGLALAVVDPLANAGVKTAVTTAKVGVFVAVSTAKAVVATAKWTYYTTVAVAVWTYDTSVIVANTVANTAVSLASWVYSGIASVVNDKNNLATDSMASVLLAVDPRGNEIPLQNIDENITIEPTVSDALSQQVVDISTTIIPKNVETKVETQAKDQKPKLVFVGLVVAGFGGGGGAPPQVLGVQETSEPIEEVVDTVGPGVGDSALLLTPTLYVPQCTYSLATSTGCLLATTTIRFEWTSVSGADYYSVNKNGTYTTTTELFSEVTADDFSDYTFEVSAIGSIGSTSATSSQVVSVATIPIAINEIAWMGTVASANDEWFEIKNNTNHTIDLSQWALNAKDGTPHVSLSGTIDPRAYLIFERTDETTVNDVVSHQIYTGALGNTGEQLSLSYASTTLDQTPDVSGGAWTAGTTTTKSTMERYSSRETGTDVANWGTNLNYVKNGTDASGNMIAGTPGEQNSVSTLVNKGQDITEDFILIPTEERYIIAGTMSVSASSTLTIAPGVNIVFYEQNWQNSAELDIYGTLNVSGTSENPVTFSSFTSTPVGSIELLGNSTSTITSAHFDTTYAGVNIYGGSLEVSGSSFENIKNESVGVYSGAIASVASTTISNTTRGDAIGVYGGSELTVASTTIDGVVRGSGIAVYDSELSIASSTIRNVVDDSGLLLSNASSTISDVVIENAGWAGVDVYEGTATITNTDVSGVTGWAGISVTAPSEPVVITGGEVTGNITGVSLDAESAILVDVSVHDNGTSEDDNIVVW